MKPSHALAALALCAALGGCDRDAPDDGALATAAVDPVPGADVITEPPLPPGYPGIDPLVAEALERALEGVRSDAADAAAWIALGMVYQANWYPALAEPCYARAAALDPGEPRAWFHLATVRSEQSDPTGAIEAMTKAVELAQFSSPTHWRLGLMHLEVGDGPTAEAAFKRATEINPKDAPAWFGLARAHLIQDDGAAAENIVKNHLLRGPHAGYGRYLLAHSYANQGRSDEYRAEIVRAASTPPPWRDEWSDEMLRQRTGLEPMRQNAMIRIRAGRPGDAIVIVEHLLQYWPDDRQLYNTLALAHARTGEFARSLDILDATLSMAPDDYTTLLMIGRVNHIGAKSIDDVRTALEYVDRSLGVNPTFAPALELKGTLHFQLTEFEEAAAAYRAAVAADARKASLLVEAARCHIARRSWADAADACRDAIERDDTLGQAHLGLAIALMEMGELEECSAALDSAGGWILAGDPAYRVLREKRTELARRRAEGAP